ncbi:hypothetical protein C8A03DRAFT_12374 [Achaetomium macrosporum]|uniref:Uncharacterized protein n=1 Tax=Achaetomium macrosporum TaxID=79813 RepID=A0AAN7CFY4_9PEZI|nr:hypothetical protein C8A03DRAFT_12374 [Achaetomium macrosporum]
MAERMNWDHHADHDLLTAMMQELQPTQEQLRGVMNRMHSFGYNCTVKAITQHLQKLRRKEGPGPAANNDGAGPASPKPTSPKTPGGRKKNVAGSAKNTPGSAKRKKAAAADSGSVTGNDDGEPDAKKVKEEDVKQELESEE